MFKNVILKISGESLSGKTDKLHDEKMILNLINQILEIKANGVFLSIVVGGGNIWRGRDDDSGIEKAASHQIGMMASVMNGMFIREKFEMAGIKAVVMTPFKVGGMTVLYERDAAKLCLKSGAVPIFAGGTGLPFFSTDTIVAVRGAEMGCDGLIFLKEYEDKVSNRILSGIYDRDPKNDLSAVKFDKLTYNEFMERNLWAIDIAAASICASRDSGDMTGVVINEGIENAIVLSVMGHEEESFKKFATVLTKKKAVEII